MKKKYSRQNDYIKSNYKQQTITIKRDIVDLIKEKYPDVSMNGYINNLIKQDLKIE